MGTIIKSICLQNSSDEVCQLSLISDVAKSCLSMAGNSIEEVGMLINTGIYTENHLTEPAKAALIQYSLNGKYSTLKEEWNENRNLFSFDLHCGGGGILQALQVLVGFIEAGEIENGLIVSGDVNPLTKTNASNLRYRHGAAAVLVSNSIDNSGFIKFRTDTHTEYIDNYKCTTSWCTGKFQFTSRQKLNYLENCVKCTTKSIKSFFEENNLSWNDFDVVLTSQSPQGFVPQLKKHLDINDKVLFINENPKSNYDGLLFSIFEFFNMPQLPTARNILFISVGAGITVSLATYKNIA